MPLRVTALFSLLFADRRQRAVVVPALCVIALAGWAIGKNLIAFFSTLTTQSPAVIAATSLAGFAAACLVWRARRRFDLHRERLLLIGGRVQDGLEMLAPTALAITVFLCGAVLLMSGATPAIDSRLAGLAEWIPLGLLEFSHMVGSAVGLGLLILARGLHRRLDGAWWLTLALLAAGAIASLLKGLDYEEALLLASILLVLLRTEYCC